MRILFRFGGSLNRTRGCRQTGYDDNVVYNGDKLCRDSEQNVAVKKLQTDEFGSLSVAVRRAGLSQLRLTEPFVWLLCVACRLSYYLYPFSDSDRKGFQLFPGGICDFEIM